MKYHRMIAGWLASESRRLAVSEAAFLLKDGNRFWLFNEKREVVCSMLAFANQRAYIRNDSEIICIDLKK